MRLLIFGSSARRGATGWTDVARVSSLLATALPDVVIEGESPCGGADALAREVAESLGIAVDPYPQRDDVDGPRGFLRRNERMHRDGKPDVAAGFVSGKVGSPLSGGSAAMAAICVRAGTPLVVYREDGVEPYADLATAYHQMRRLYVATLDERLVAPGQALKALATMNAASREEVLAALGYARDGSRWAPWIEAVEATVKVC